MRLPRPFKLPPPPPLLRVCCTWLFCSAPHVSSVSQKTWSGRSLQPVAAVSLCRWNHEAPRPGGRVVPGLTEKPGLSASQPGFSSRDPSAFAPEGPCPHLLGVCSLCHCFPHLEISPLDRVHNYYDHTTSLCIGLLPTALSLPPSNPTASPMCLPGS